MKIEALRQIAESENPDDDTMADDSAAPKSTKSKPQQAHAAQVPVIDDRAGDDEDEEIT